VSFDCRAWRSFALQKLTARLFHARFAGTNHACDLNLSHPQNLRFNIRVFARRHGAGIRWNGGCVLRYCRGRGNQCCLFAKKSGGRRPALIYSNARAVGDEEGRLDSVATTLNFHQL
jgi:hypothetical protein